jgi:hypothetical protein
MPSVPSEAGISSEHTGDTHHFCSRGSKGGGDKNPNVSQFLPSGPRDLHFPVCRSHGCCIHQLNWFGCTPERMSSGVDCQLFEAFAGLALVGKDGAVRALEKGCSGLKATAERKHARSFGSRSVQTSARFAVLSGHFQN